MGQNPGTPVNTLKALGGGGGKKKKRGVVTIPQKGTNCQLGFDPQPVESADA